MRTEEEINKSKEEKAAAVAAQGATAKEGEEVSTTIITRSLTESADVEVHTGGKTSIRIDETPTASRQRENNDFDSDALDPSIIPKGGGMCTHNMCSHFYFC